MGLHPDFDEDYMVAEPGEKRLQPLLTARPPISSSSDNHERTRWQKLVQRMFAIAAEAYLDSDFLTFDFGLGHQIVLALLEEFDRHARLIQRQAKRNHFGDNQTHSRV